MILSHTLICPPNTVSCLFPALAKEQSKTAVILESPQLASTFHWFTYFGNSAKNIKVITLNPQQLQMDQEQAFIDSQYVGFSVGEVIQKQPEDQEHAQGQQQNHPSQQNHINNDRSDPGSISMNIDQNLQSVESNANINQDGYKLLKDENGSNLKTFDEAQKEAEGDHEATGDMIDTSISSSNEHAKEGNQKVETLHLDFGISQNGPEDGSTNSNNSNGEIIIEDGEDPDFDFDFDALFGRER